MLYCKFEEILVWVMIADWCDRMQIWVAFIPVKLQRQIFKMSKTKEKGQMTMALMMSLNELCMQWKTRWKIIGVGQPYNQKRRLKIK